VTAQPDPRLVFEPGDGNVEPLDRSSIERSSRSHPACSAILLSAITWARFWASLRWPNRTIGTWAMPSRAPSNPPMTRMNHVLVVDD
jgi:hypothetical protein